MRPTRAEATRADNRRSFRLDVTDAVPHASPMPQTQTRNARVALALFGVWPEQPSEFRWSDRRGARTRSDGSQTPDLHVT